MPINLAWGLSPSTYRRTMPSRLCASMREFDTTFSACITRALLVEIPRDRIGSLDRQPVPWIGVPLLEWSQPNRPAPASSQPRMSHAPLHLTCRLMDLAALLNRWYGAFLACKQTRVGLVHTGVETAVDAETLRPNGLLKRIADWEDKGVDCAT